jgi:DNA-binding transcriptional regulator YhcF (GntR family)
MAYDPDDKRPLFQQVVDKIKNQIRDGVLAPDDKVPSAATLAAENEIANMTAQRALRELQAAGLTYGVAGRGSFVHPQAAERIAQADAEADRADAAVLWKDKTPDLAEAMAALKAALDSGDVTAAQKASSDLDSLISRISLDLNGPAIRRDAQGKVRAYRRKREAEHEAKTTEE